MQVPYMSDGHNLAKKKHVTHLSATEAGAEGGLS